MRNRLKLVRWCWLLWLVGGVLPACDEADTCKSAPACSQQGKCTAGDTGKCIVGSAHDCNSSELCSLHGRCSFAQGACTAASDADCKSSQDCQKQHTCDAYRGSCVDLANSVHAECVTRCESDGLCVMSGGKCAALSRLHCAGTMNAKPEAASPCATQGRCNAENGRCTAASNEDCARFHGLQGRGALRRQRRLMSSLQRKTARNPALARARASVTPAAERASPRAARCAANPRAASSKEPVRPRTARVSQPLRLTVSSPRFARRPSTAKRRAACASAAGPARPARAEPRPTRCARRQWAASFNDQRASACQKRDP